MHHFRAVAIAAGLATIAAVCSAAPVVADCQAGGPVEPKSLAFVVFRVERRPAGEFIVTFENGEVWQQSDLKNKVIIARGDQVVIRRASNGSFTLVSRDGQSTRVKRVH
jgi:hypothetical protein